MIASVDGVSAYGAIFRALVGWGPEGGWLAVNHRWMNSISGWKASEEMIFSKSDSDSFFTNCFAP